MLMYIVNLPEGVGSANLFRSVWPQKAFAHPLISINPLPEPGGGGGGWGWGRGRDGEGSLRETGAREGPGFCSRNLLFPLRPRPVA